MKVYVTRDLETTDIFEINANSLKEVFSYLKYTKGEQYTDEIINNSYAYLLADRENSKIIPILDEVLFLIL